MTDKQTKYYNKLVEKKENDINGFYSDSHEFFIYVTGTLDTLIDEEIINGLDAFIIMKELDKTEYI